MQLPFAKTRTLEKQVDEFLDIIIKGVLSMKQGILSYLAADQEEFENRIRLVSNYEKQADANRKHIETELYTFSLIPESRGDVLGLLETLDNIIDGAKEVLQDFEVQLPAIPEEYHAAFIALTECSIQAADHVVAASRCYFRSSQEMKDHLTKVKYYEGDADRAGLKLKKQIFRSQLELARKLHMRSFADLIESISDIAEQVAERLTIAAIKRTI